MNHSRSLQLVCTCLLAAVLAGACAPRHKKESIRSYTDQRGAGARLLGTLMKQDGIMTGPILLVSRSESSEVLKQVEGGLREGLGLKDVRFIRVQDAPEDPAAFMRPTAENTGLAAALKSTPDASAAVVMCRLFDLRPSQDQKWPPLFAFDWSIYHLDSHRGEFTSRIYHGGVFQKAAPQPFDVNADWTTVAAACYEAVQGASTAR